MALNESPSEKEGKLRATGGANFLDQPSMKVPPKRKGNLAKDEPHLQGGNKPLNESPSEKEGKSERN